MMTNRVEDVLFQVPLSFLTISSRYFFRGTVGYCWWCSNRSRRWLWLIRCLERWRGLLQENGLLKVLNMGSDMTGKLLIKKCIWLLKKADPSSGPSLLLMSLL